MSEVTGCADGAPPASAVVIVVDTLRADHLSAYGYDRPTSPNLDGLQGGDWLRFTRAYSHAPWTLPAFASILTALPPPVHRAGKRLTEKNPGEVGIFDLRDSIRTAPAILREDHGFRTAAFVNNPYLDRSFGLHRGFEHYDHVVGSNQHSRRAGELVDRAVAWLRALPPDAPSFLLLHLFDPHLDYDPPPDFAASFAGEEWRTRRPDPDVYARIKLRDELPPAEQRAQFERLYDGEIAYVDQEIARFLDGLRELERYRSTAILITADHGEEFWDHGAFEHGHALYDELVRVPLWLKLPARSPHRSRIPPGGAVSQLVCHADLLPTLLDVLDIETDAPLMGSSYFSAAGGSDRCYLGYTLYGRRHRGLVKGDHKLIENQATGEVELYDLRRDPRERSDQSATDPQRTAALLAELDALEGELKRLGHAMGAASPRALDDATLERLRAMGYIR